MNRIIYIISLGLLASMIACSSPEKEAAAQDGQNTAKSQDSDVQNLSTQAPRTPAVAVPNPELDNKSLEGFIDDETLMEVMEITEIEQLTRKMNKKGELVVTWPRNENPKEKVELVFSRGEAFSGGMDEVRMMSEGANTMFFDDIGNLGGYYVGGEEDDFYFPLGGYMYKIKLPDVFPSDLKAEKGRMLALKIWEVVQ